MRNNKLVLGRNCDFCLNFNVSLQKNHPDNFATSEFIITGRRRKVNVKSSSELQFSKELKGRHIYLEIQDSA